MASEREQARMEIKDCIAFYEARGWNWLDVVTFLGMKYTGRLDHYLNPFDRGNYFLMRKREARGK